MADKRKKDKNQLLIRLPDNVMKALKVDAARCRRSNTKHIEAILIDLYGLEEVSLKDVRPTRSRICSDGVIDSMAGMIEMDETEEVAS